MIRLLPSFTRTFAGLLLCLALDASAQTKPAATPPPAADASATPANAGSAPTTAARDEEVVTLSAFEVTTSSDVGYQSMHSADATRMNTPIADIPMNITVFNEEFLEDIMARRTEDVLFYDPSVTQISENDGFMVRGIKNASTNFLNGFPMEEGLGSQPLANIERVTVIKGPNAVIFGTGGFGGVVNRETKRPRTRPHTRFRTIFGEDSSWRFEFDHNEPLGDGKKFLFRVNGAWEDGLAAAPWNTPIKEKSIGTSFTWNIARATKLNVEYFFNDTQRQAQWGAPIVNGNPYGITVGDGSFLSYGERRLNFNDASDNRRNRRHIAMADFSHALTRNIEFRTQVLFEKKLQNNQETVASPEGLIILRDAVLLPRHWTRDVREQDNFRLRTELTARLETGFVSQRFIVGFSYADQQLIFDQDASSRNFGGITNAAYLNATDGIVPVNQMRYDNTGIVNAGQTAAQVRDFRNVGIDDVLADPRVVGLNPNLILPINVFDRSKSFAVPGVAARAPLLLGIRRDTAAENLETYINDIIALWENRVYINAGVRYTHSEQYRADWVAGSHPSTYFLVTPNTTERTDHGLAHNLGMVFHFDRQKRISLYGNLNRSFEPQAQVRQTFEGDLLPPELGKQRELGLKLNLADGRFQALITWFNLDHQNVSGADPVNTGFFIPLDARKSEGVEFGYNIRATKDWNIFGGYAFTQTKDDPGYKRFISSADRSPRHAFTVFNRWNNVFVPGLSFSIGTIFTGEREIAQTNINTTRRAEPFWGPTPETWQVDTNLSYSLRLKKSIMGRRASMQFSLRATNVLNETDILYYASEYEWRARAGRVIEAAVGLRF